MQVLYAIVCTFCIGCSYCVGGGIFFLWGSNFSMEREGYFLCGGIKISFTD